MRLFVAVEIPPDVRSSIGAALQRLRDRAPRLRWVDPSRYHLTLVFLGSVDEAAVPAIEEALAAAVVGVPAFALSLDGRLGTFGRRVLWAGLEPSEALASAAAAVAAALGAVVDVPNAERPFRSHLTLARAGREPVRSSLIHDAGVPPLTWPVERVALMRSAGGYSVVRGFPLAVRGA